MWRFIDGIAYRGKPSDSRFEVRVHELADGQREVSASRCIDWEEVGPVDPDVPTPEETEADRAEREEANRRRAARRAKVQVRRLCKAQGLDSLVTLTYRANVTELATCKHHLSMFLKRVARMWSAMGLEGFRYVAAFERQKRGAWHVHIATRDIPKVLPARGGVRVKSWNVLRAAWRAVTGEAGGNVDVRLRRPGQRASVARIASYLSKYLTKAFEEGDHGSRRWQASQGIVPRPTVLQFTGCSWLDVVELCVGEAARGLELRTVWLGDTDRLYCAAEAPSS